MARAKQESDWNHTASVLAMTANINRDTKKRRKPFEPMEFHPFANKAKDVKQSIGTMRELFEKNPINEVSLK